MEVDGSSKYLNKDMNRHNFFGYCCKKVLDYFFFAQNVMIFFIPLVCLSHQVERLRYVYMCPWREAVELVLMRQI